MKLTASASGSSRSVGSSRSRPVPTALAGGVRPHAAPGATPGCSSRSGASMPRAAASTASSRSGTSSTTPAPPSRAAPSRLLRRCGIVARAETGSAARIGWSSQPTGEVCLHGVPAGRALSPSSYSHRQVGSLDDDICWGLRRIVGGSSVPMRRACQVGFEKALDARQENDGDLVAHSDNGSQYTHMNTPSVSSAPASLPAAGAPARL